MPQPVFRSGGQPAQTVLDAALALHAAGWWAVPQAGKRAVAYGWGDWRLSEDDVRTYFSDGRLNLAIALHQSPCIDVECDSPEAEELLIKLSGGASPRTPTWRSRRGLHRLFVRPDGCPDKAVAHVGGIEFRLGRGHNPRTASTVPPSVHPDTGKRYEWVPGLSLAEVEPAVLPAPLLKLLLSAPRKALRESSGCADDGDIPEGRRNDELFRAGCRAISSDPGVNLSDLLHGANRLRCKPPLDDNEVDAIVRSALEKAEESRTDEMPLWCDRWDVLAAAWAEALELHGDMLDVLAVMLAVSASTVQTGDQLFLQVVGDPGTAKTRFCDAMLVSKKCVRLEKAKGFFSGVIDPKDPTKDFSFLARANRRCMITPEADIFMSAPGALELMSEQRRIFDGSASTSFKNRDKDTVYQGLRTPWIMAGTPAMFAVHNQSHLGDRFLRVRMRSPDEATRGRILTRVGRTAWDSVCQESNCSPDSVNTPQMSLAKRLTGGYVEWLRANVTTRLAAVRAASDEAWVVCRCASLADFAAFMRSRPPDHLGYREPDYEATKELPSRLQAQFVRLAACLAVVLQRHRVDARVMALVRRVALDTAGGRTLDLTRLLWTEAGAGGAPAESVAVWAREPEDRTLRWLKHMERVEVVTSGPREDGGVTYQPRRWRLTDRLTKLCEEVLRADPRDQGQAGSGPRAVVRQQPIR